MYYINHNFLHICPLSSVDGREDLTQLNGSLALYTQGIPGPGASYVADGAALMGPPQQTEKQARQAKQRSPHSWPLQKLHFPKHYVSTVDKKKSQKDDIMI